MVSTVVLVSIASPVIIVLIVVLILLISTRSSISGMKDDLKRMKSHEDDLKTMKSHVNINTEAVDLIIPWVSAAQKTFMIPGFGSY